MIGTNLQQQGGPSEVSPLLRNPVHEQGEQRPGPSDETRAGLLTTPTVRVPQAENQTTIISLICLVNFLASSAGGFLGIPQTRMIEDVLCHQHYQGHDGPIEEGMCKLASIQSKLAYILAVQIALDSIVSFFAAFPWSLVADRYCLIFSRAGWPAR